MSERGRWKTFQTNRRAIGKDNTGIVGGIEALQKSLGGSSGVLVIRRAHIHLLNIGGAGVQADDGSGADAIVGVLAKVAGVEEGAGGVGLLCAEGGEDGGIGVEDDGGAFAGAGEDDAGPYSVEGVVALGGDVGHGEEEGGEESWGGEGSHWWGECGTALCRLTSDAREVQR